MNYNNNFFLNYEIYIYYDLLLFVIYYILISYTEKTIIICIKISHNYIDIYFIC